jgi:hypothetical protein
MQINPDKTELMLVSSATQLKLYDQSKHLDVAGTKAALQKTVKILGVTLDSHLAYDSHVSSICNACSYHMHALRHIRPMLSLNAANQLACSIVAFRLDYCNSLLYSTSKNNLLRLQRIQNNLARIVCNARRMLVHCPFLKNCIGSPLNNELLTKFLSSLTQPLHTTHQLILMLL